MLTAARIGLVILIVLLRLFGQRRSAMYARAKLIVIDEQRKNKILAKQRDARVTSYDDARVQHHKRIIPRYDDD